MDKNSRISFTPDHKDKGKLDEGFRKNHAFVIGINQYSNGIRPLTTAVNDARRLADILENEYAYEVSLFTEDVTRSKIEDHLCRYLTTSVENDDRLLFYFAGHGVIDKEMIDKESINSSNYEPLGFLLLQDSNREDSKTFLSMTELHGWLTKLNCRHMLAILDCCFAGAFRWSALREAPALPPIIHQERYKRFVKDPAWQVITSASYDQNALDSLGIRGEAEGHSPFAKALFEGLAGAADLIPKGQGDGVITASELYLYLRDVVDIEHGKVIRRRQTPELWPLRKHRKGEYVFLVPGCTPDLPPAPILNDANNPYRSLDSYEESDQELFFGRLEQIEELAALASKHPLTIVLGASGTGKSSLVKAGLLPYLRKQSTTQWHILPVLRPGSHPHFALSSLIDGNKADQQGANEERGQQFQLDDWIQQFVAYYDLKSNRESNQRILMVIDQFEELVTQCTEDEQTHFVQHLCEILRQLSDHLHIVLTLRNDFEPHFKDTELQKFWNSGRLVVAPMNQDQLRAVIEGPAAARVLYFEPPELVDEIINDVVHEPFALPLLSFTLSELYRKYVQREGDNRALTRFDYSEIGGVVGSLRRRANDIYDHLDESQQATMRRIMVRMVSTEGGELARRRVPQHELIYTSQIENQRVDYVIEQLVKARLLAKGAIEGTDKSFVEPVHEAMIRAWDRLVQWMREDDETILLQRRLTDAAQEWTQAPGNAKRGLLWNSDPRLPLVHQILAPSDYENKSNLFFASTLRRLIWPKFSVPNAPTWLNQQDVLFIQESIKYRASIVRWITLITTLVITFLSIASLIANYQRNIAIQERDNTLAAESRRLANIALQGIATDPLLSVDQSLSVLPSSTQQRPYVPEAEYALTEAIQRNQLEQQLDTNLSNPEQIAIGSGLIVVGSSPLELLNRVQLSAATQAQAKLTNLANGIGISDSLIGLNTKADLVRWANNGDLLVVRSKDLAVWHHQTELITQTVDALGYVSCAEWSPTSETVALCSDNTVWLWSPLTGVLTRLPEFASFVNSVSWAGDAKTLVVATPDHLLLHTVGSDTNKIIGSSESEIIAARAVTSSQLLVWSYDAKIRLLTFTGEELARFENPINYRQIRGIELSEDQTQLAAYREDGSIDIWQMSESTLAPRSLQGHSGQGITTVAWIRNILASAGVDGTIHVWDVPTQQLLTRLSGHTGRVQKLTWQPDQQRLLSLDQSGTLRIWRVFDHFGEPICKLETPDALPDCTTLLLAQIQQSDVVEHVAWRSDKLVVGTTKNGKVFQWDIRDPSATEVATGKEGQLLKLAPTGDYALFYTEHGGGDLWHDQVKKWSPVDLAPGPIDQAFWSESKLIEVELPGKLRVVNLETLTSITLTVNTTSEVWQVSADGSHLAVAFKDGSLSFFDIADGKNTFTFTGTAEMPFGGLSWLDEGQSLLTQIAVSGTLSLINMESGSVQWSYIPTDKGFGLVEPIVHPSEKYAAFAIDSAIFIVDVTNKANLLRRIQVDNNVQGLKWNKEGSRLINWSTDGYVQIWHWNTTDYTLTPILSVNTNSSLQSVALNPSETAFLTVDNQGVLRVWKIWPTLEALTTEAFTLQIEQKGSIP